MGHHDPPEVTGAGTAGCEIGAETGGFKEPAFVVGGRATRAPVAEPLARADVDAAVLELDERPDSPIAAIAENAVESATEAATASRVSFETERMPRSRARPTRLRRAVVRWFVPTASILGSL